MLQVLGYERKEAFLKALLTKFQNKKSSKAHSAQHPGLVTTDQSPSGVEKYIIG